MRKYRKTATVEAEQWNGSAEMAKKYQLKYYDEQCVIETLEGKMRVNFGDYICTGVNGEYWPVRKDIFEKAYEPVPEHPEEVVALEFINDHRKIYFDENGKHTRILGGGTR